MFVTCVLMCVLTGTWRWFLFKAKHVTRERSTIEICLSIFVTDFPLHVPNYKDVLTRTAEIVLSFSIFIFSFFFSKCSGKSNEKICTFWPNDVVRSCLLGA